MGPVTTATERTCTHVTQRNYIAGVVAVHALCNAPAVWVTDDGPRCPEHVGEDENGRRAGVVEGTED